MKFKHVSYNCILCTPRNLPGTLLHHFLLKLTLKTIFKKICTILNTKQKFSLLMSGIKEMTRNFAWGWKVGDKGFGFARLDFLCSIINRGSLNDHWDTASSPESGNLGRFISNKYLPNIQTKLSSGQVCITHLWFHLPSPAWLPRGWEQK